MSDSKPTYEDLEARLAQAEAILDSLRSGEVDAILGDRGLLVLRLQNAEAERNKAESELRDALTTAQRFRKALDGAPSFIYMKDSQSRYVYANQPTLERFGCSAEELVGCDDTRFFPPDAAARLRKVDSRVLLGEQTTEEIDVSDGERGRRVYWEVKTPIYEDPESRTAWGLLGISTDITERKRAEMEHEKLQVQLAQAQKMESVGRLAGGVAHDFNNLLMGTMNYVELCRDGIEPDHPIRKWLDEITTDSKRSANLTRQLLAFARKQIIAPKVLDLNDAVSSMLKLLRRLIGEDIDLAWLPGPAVGTVKMDPSQLDQILANLAVNARDAIGGVGRLTIETRNVSFDATTCAGYAGFVPGDYVLLTVGDDGCGMDAETREHIFDPFFTTKDVGEGTGLGLATVYGIVTQNNGFIKVYSEPGSGTTFKVYLPRATAEQAAEVAGAPPTQPPRGDETVLLVEDEKSVRITVQIFLENLGYTVLVADEPEQALALVAEHPGEIHLLITDVIMPRMSGRDLAKRLSEIRPSIQCLFISGFTADVIVQRGILTDGVDFLSKPFGRDALAHKVREVLEGSVKSPTSTSSITGEAL